MDSMDINELKDGREDKATADLSIPVEELRDRYENLYTGTVSDAMRERGLMDQTLPPRVRPLERDMKICGIAFTVQSCADPTIEGEMEVRADMLDVIEEHHVCVWDANGDSQAAHWGEVMTTTARSNGSVGAVLDGGVRDTRQVLEQDFPVFNTHFTPDGALGRSRIKKYQSPIQIGSVIIRPGDIVFGDIDGVVVVPRDIALDVLERSEEIKQNDEDVKTWVAEGASTSDIIDRGGYF
jgi:regulator of RNase E activity RraA